MQDEASARPMTPLLAAMWSFTLFVLVQVCVGATEAIRPGALTDVVNVCACSLLATSVVIFAMVRVHARDASLRRTLGVLAPAPTHVFLAVAAGSGLFPLKTAIDHRILAWRPYSQDEADLLSKLTDVPTMHARVLLVVTLMVLMPIAGELVFRGVLFGELRRAAGATVAQLVIECAASRHESRGLHFTSDYPNANASLERDTVVKRGVPAHLRGR